MLLALKINERSHAFEINRWKSYQNIFNGQETDGDIAELRYAAYLKRDVFFSPQFYKSTLLMTSKVFIGKNIQELKIMS